MNETTERSEIIETATIMIVDDEPTTIDVLEMLLREEGYRNFTSTTEPKRVLAMLGEGHPDVLLLNLLMPNVSGLEILDSMRADPVLRQIPVIILTSATDAAVKRRALELGAVDFLAKPVDPSELALRLRGTLLANAYRVGLGASRAEAESPRPPQVASQSGASVVSRLDGKGPRFRKILATFATRLQVKLAAMEASWEAGDLEELANLAHWLKGAAGTVGFDAFTAPAQTLNALASEGKEEGVEALLRELRELADRIAVSTVPGG